MVVFVFALTAVVAAGLLFVIEPMAAKALLPAVGGSPTLWNVSMVLFQTLLLGGYAWAHLLARRLSPRAQAMAQAVVLLAAAALLPWRELSASTPPEGPPALWVLRALFTRVGVPFFVLASTGPLVQRWLALVSRASDPYFLYAAGNAASLGALLAYPLVLERALPLEGDGAPLTQRGLFCVGFLVYAVLGLACAALVMRAREAPVAEKTATPWRARLAWTALAFVPSSATLAVTQAITTDVAAVPLLWTLPLALYLLTFVLAFAARGQRALPVALPVALPIASWAVAALSLAVAASQWVSFRPSPQVALPLHLTTLFAVGMLCHGRLAASRPDPRALTDYYLCIAAGGALGSLFCGLLAPLLFRSVAEYPLALVLACLARPHPGADRSTGRIADLVLPLGVAGAMVIAHVAIGGAPGERSFSQLRAEALVGCLTCALLAFRPVAFAAGVALVFAAIQLGGPSASHDLAALRTFFGVLRVKDLPGPPPRRLPMHQLFNGTTLHGLQVRTSGLDRQASSYFHPSGPIGHLFRAVRATPRGREIGVVGLGAGELAAYAEPGSRFTFVEIDPAVARIARDPTLFSYLRDSRGQIDVVVADGRLAMASEPDGRFGVLVIDAFSSDSMPVHLLTREAMALFLRKLRPGGLLALNVTGRYFDLGPVVAAVAADLGRPGLFWHDQSITAEELAQGKLVSSWAIVAAAPADLAALRADARWQPLEALRPRDGRRPWTDRHASPLSALR
jgi:SAM-dependent methyltransferase